MRPTKKKTEWRWWFRETILFHNETLLIIHFHLIECHKPNFDSTKLKGIVNERIWVGTKSHLIESSKIVRTKPWNSVCTWFNQSEFENRTKCLQFQVQLNWIRSSFQYLFYIWYTTMISNQHTNHPTNEWANNPTKTIVLNILFAWYHAFDFEETETLRNVFIPIFWKRMENKKKLLDFKRKKSQQKTESKSESKFRLNWLSRLSKSKTEPFLSKKPRIDHHEIPINLNQLYIFIFPTLSLARSFVRRSFAHSLSVSPPPVFALHINFVPHPVSVR